MKLFSLVILAVALTGSGLAQCSDAGVCSFGGGHDTPSHQLSFDFGTGKSDKVDDISFLAVKVTGDIQILEKSRLTIAVPFTRQSGPAGTTSGIGDLIVAWNQRFTDGKGVIVEGQIGARLPTGKVDNSGLPQRYQNGLGTTDLLVGVNLTSGPWSAGAGVQVPFGRSENPFDRLKRGQDVMLRAGYTQAFGPFSLNAEVIGIKRFGLSSVRDTAVQTERFVDVAGSDQGQVNIVIAPGWALSDVLHIQAAGALPLLQREINIDGLKRVFTASLGVRLML